MSYFMMVPVYPVKEACEELARREGRARPYKKQTISYLIRKFRPEVLKVGNQYLLTDCDIDAFLRLKGTLGRPKKLDI